MRHPPIGIVAAALMLSIVLAAEPASADVGLPMIAIYLPPAWLAFIPIVIVEAGFGVWCFGLPLKRCLVAQVAANGFSTLVGIPIAWVILASVEVTFFGTALGLGSPMRRLYAVTVQAPWLIPYEEDFGWMVPASVMVLTVPFYVLSVVSEYFVVARFFPGLTKSTVRSWALVGNALSYALLLALIGGVWIFPTKFEQALRPAAPIIEALAEFVFRVASFVHGK